jgi:transposase-like protein
MKCPLCGHHKAHKHGKTEKGHQRYKCTHCGKTFPEHFETLYYNRHLSPAEVHTILQSHAEGSSQTRRTGTNQWNSEATNREMASATK